MLAFAGIAAHAAEPTAQPTTGPALKTALDDWLEGVSLDKSEAALKAALVSQPRDDNLRFRLGAAQTARAVERLGQALYRHGFGNQQGAWLWMLTPPVPLRVSTNPQPAPLTYGELRRILSTWCDDLARAEATLAEIRDPDVAFAVRIGQIRLDMDGDGVATERERLISFDSGPSVARFDRADVAWWRAYCHLLMAFTEFYLAHDTAEFFDRTATLVFPAARVSQPLVEMTPSGGDFYEEIVDMAAVVHLVRWRVQEPHRMLAVLEHLEAMVRLNREMWTLVEAETDNEFEWIPNARQTSIMRGGVMSATRIKAWRAMLDEAAEILAGRKLVPLWRGAKPRGINIRRVFTEPREFDLVLWVQGAAALPYVEDGPLTTRETWEALIDAFRGDLLGFALWLN